MNGHAAVVLSRVALAVVLTVGGFLALQGGLRRVEARASVALVRMAGGERVLATPGAAIQVVPARDLPFRAVVTPTCSSASSIVAIGCLAYLTPRHRRRRLLAAAVSVATVFAGNVIRIAASLGVGLVAGRSSLILFHDWVGSMFAFAYTLGGYILLLFILLERRTRPMERLSCVQPPTSSSPSLSASLPSSWPSACG